MYCKFANLNIFSFMEEQNSCEFYKKKNPVSYAKKWTVTRAPAVQKIRGDARIP
jgi:hypothetical protein